MWCSFCNSDPEDSDNPEVIYLKCSACKSVRYCSVECQNKDWKRHKKTCKLYKTKEFYNTIVLYDNSKIEYKTYCVNDMRKVWGCDWSEGFIMEYEGLFYRIEGHECGRIIGLKPNPNFNSMYGSLTICRILCGSESFWGDTNVAPKKRGAQIIHNAQELLNNWKLTY